MRDVKSDGSVKTVSGCGLAVFVPSKRKNQGLNLLPFPAGLLVVGPLFGCRGEGPTLRHGLEGGESCIYSCLFVY